MSAIDVTVDHVEPVSQDGSLQSMSNIKLAHRWCNNRRGILPWTYNLAMVCRETILQQRKTGLEWLSKQKHRQLVKELA